MKRSRNISLVILAGVGLSACDNPPPAKNVQDVAQCIEIYRDEVNCEKAAKSAETWHVSNKPEYATKEECDKSHSGDCQTSSGTRYSPIYRGFYYNPAHPSSVQPLYNKSWAPATPTSGWSTQSGSTNHSAPVAAAPSRGGFGTTATSVSSISSVGG